MSRHEGVSCDSCLKGNFRGKRYKCLICYDYDLCSTCYEAGATTTRHTTDHPVQCILTRTDFDLYYGVEALTAEQPQAFTCPYCGKMGYTESTLQDHVTSEHADASVEVVCPICASLPGGDPNHVTDDFAAHLTLEHRTPREFDEPTGIRHVRRIPHPGRGVGGTRTRRANMHFSSGGSALSGLSPSGRETMDPIAELLSQLSSVRSRAAAAQSVSSQLQQLEMQLQTTRMPHSYRQQLERLPRRQAEGTKNTATSNNSNSNVDQQGTTTSASSTNTNSQFLLSRCVETGSTESEQNVERERVDRSMFVQELLLSTLTEQLHLHGDMEDFTNLLEVPSEPPPMDEGGGQQVDNSQRVSSSLQNKSVPQKETEKPLQSIQKSAPSGGGGQGSGARPSVIQGQNSRPVQGVNSSGQAMNNVGGSSLVLPPGGAAVNPGNLAPYPLPGRPSSAGRDRDRDARVHPPAAKRNMLKHLPATKTSDKEPPPH